MTRIFKCVQHFCDQAILSSDSKLNTTVFNSATPYNITVPWLYKTEIVATNSVHILLIIFSENTMSVNYFLPLQHVDHKQQIYVTIGDSAHQPDRHHVIMSGVFFVSPSTFSLPPPFRPHRQQQRPRPRVTPPISLTAQYSNPFPQLDPFAFPALAFPVSTAPDLRPELLGALLWTFGLYFGFSQRQRWAASVNQLLKRIFALFIPSTSLSTLLADALHWLPFFAAGICIDGLLRYAASSNAVWAISTGTSVALYAGVYELARQSAQRSLLSSEDRIVFDQFRSFASRWLQPSGRCHFVDIKNKLRTELPANPSLRNTSDEQLRRFVKNAFPNAKRSPNGFYRGLSVRQTPNSIETSTFSPSSSPPPTRSSSSPL